MELKYIWIEDYRNLKKIGFNFSYKGNDKFEFRDGELKNFKSEGNTPNGFFGDNIHGVTGIVGKNGSGKTNLAEFVNYNLAHVTNNSVAHWGGNNNGIIILGKFIFIQESISINNLQYFKDQGYTEIFYKKNPLDLGRKETLSNSMEKNRYIYYNPSFDFRFIKVYNNLTNISTGYLAFNDLSNSIKHERENSRLYNKTKTDSLYAHYRNEKLRESNFIINYSDEIERLIGQVPADIIFSVDHSTNNQLLNFRYPTTDEIKNDPKKKVLYQNQSDLYDLELEMLSLYRIKQYKVPEPEITGYDVYKIEIGYKKDQFKILFFIQLFKILLLDNEFPIGEFSQFIYTGKITLENRLLMKGINDLGGLIDKLIELPEWKIEIEKLRSDGYFESNERELNTYDLFCYLEISVDTDEKRILFNKVISITNDLTEHRLNFHYEFKHKMSSGQQNLVNFFSRLLWSKENIDLRESEVHSTKSEQIILFIDEGEITFHPEWQRRYFKEAISFIKKLFANRNIQLLITTHSPFVLSDLPKQNVIFLEKDSNGNAVKSALENENTFGANIHDLLSNSFFMESTIGEFASDKIKEIVNFYYRTFESKSDESIGVLKQEYSSKRDKFHFIIDSIGDNVVKGILENHIEFIENTLLGQSYVKNRIAKLEDELKKLKGNND